MGAADMAEARCKLFNGPVSRFLANRREVRQQRRAAHCAPTPSTAEPPKAAADPTGGVILDKGQYVFAPNGFVNSALPNCPNGVCPR